MDRQVCARSRTFVVGGRASPLYYETDIKKICQKRINILDKIKNGVYTGWVDIEGRKDHEQGLWVNQYFLFTFFCGEHRHSLEHYPDPKSVFGTIRKRGILPKVIEPKKNPPITHFLGHVLEGGLKYEDIPFPERHNVLVWKGEPIVDEDPGCVDEF